MRRHSSNPIVAPLKTIDRQFSRCRAHGAPLSPKGTNTSRLSWHDDTINYPTDFVNSVSSNVMKTHPWLETRRARNFNCWRARTLQRVEYWRTSRIVQQSRAGRILQLLGTTRRTFTVQGHTHFRVSSYEI